MGECLHARAKILLVLPEIDSLAQQSEVWVEKIKDEGRDEQLSVVRVMGMRHGWTQYPELFLKADEKVKKDMAFGAAVGFVNHGGSGMMSNTSIDRI